MNTTTDKINIQLLVKLCALKGMKHVIVSPGSRNAPLSIAFNRHKDIKCKVLVDERSAGFYALGVAQELNQPVGIVCTSGTALLNLAPAIAEAYYKEIPLIVISADRPEEWIDQDDSQTIRQNEIFGNYIKASRTLRTELCSKSDMWYNNRVVNEVFNIALNNGKGPVHINVPIDEPLCGISPVVKEEPKLINLIEGSGELSEHDLNELAAKVNSSKKIMIVCSMYHPSEMLVEAINKLSGMKQIVVLSETVANIKGENIICCVDRTISRIPQNKMKNYYPDLVISYGGALISKFLKKALRDYPPQRHWHIGEADRLIDTYGALTRKVKINPDKFFVQLTEKVVSNNSAYAKNWQKLSQTADLIHDEFLKNMPWCDFKAFSVIVPMLPKESRLQLSNGTSVRYHQLFKNGKTSRVDANRGTSGIEGSTSTAAGGAYMFEGVTTLITGDVSFLYDSNALWNKRLSRNLRIIILNNNGGGIFRFIKGPSDVPEMEDFFETPHNVDIAKLAEAYGVNYLSAQNERELRMSMKTLYAWNKTTILEIKTPRFINDEILRSYYKQTLNGK